MHGIPWWFEFLSSPWTWAALLALVVAGVVIGVVLVVRAWRAAQAKGGSNA